MQHHPRARVCDPCGAPLVAGLAACRYCKTPYAGVRPGVRCPSCGDHNAWEMAACVSCRGSLAKNCVFCGRISPLNAEACLHCREAFAGAEQRKQQREDAARRQQWMGLATEGVKAGASVAVATAIHSPGLFDAVADVLGGIAEGLSED